MSKITIDQAFVIAREHHQAGQIPQAKAIYRQILSQAPNHVAVLLLLGTICGQAGENDAAIDLIGRAIALQPNLPEAHNNLGLVWKAKGRLEEACASFQRAITIKPDLAGAHNNLGIVLSEKGELDQAMTSFQRALAIKPDYPETYLNLGNTFRKKGQLDEALAGYQQALAFKPDYAEAHNNLGILLREQGDLDAAMASYQRALAIKPDYPEALNNLGGIQQEKGQFDLAMASFQRALTLNPLYMEAHLNLGNILWKKGQLNAAISVFQRAIALKPDQAEVHLNFGNILRDNSQLDDAMASYQRALALKPDYAEAHLNVGNIHAEKGRLDEAMASFERAIAIKPDYADAYNNLAGALKDSGQLDEAMAAYQRAMSFNTTNSRIHSNLVYLLHFHADYDAPRILEEHRQWAKKFAEPLAAELRPHANDPSPGRRLRIGYISADFRAHPVGRFLAPLFSHHDHSNYEIFCYSAVVKADQLTLRLQGHTDHWKNILAMHEEAIAEQIRADRIDVLVDLALHMDSNYMMVFARKPAPVQVTWLGYASTTGLPTMDYRLSDPYLDPPGVGDQNYVEETIRLPRSFWCYELADWMPPVNPLPALQTGHITFACFNNFGKVTRPTQDLWIALLRAIPGSRLLIHSRAGKVLDDVRRRFTDAGIEPNCLEFLAMNRMDKYFAQYHAVDIALDPFPYGGGTTTCDGLTMGVPVITLAGQTAVGRAGVSLLNNIGLSELVAQTPEQYLHLATTLAGDLDRLSKLRSTLRDRMRQSPLTDAPGFARDMESAYRHMWRQWCEKSR